METETQVQQAQGQDAALRWTMRVIGLVLSITAVIFLQQDIFTSQISTWFFGICAGLGAITLVTSWLPGPERPRLQENPIIRPIQRPLR